MHIYPKWTALRRRLPLYLALLGLPLIALLGYRFGWRRGRIHTMMEGYHHGAVLSSLSARTGHVYWIWKDRWVEWARIHDPDAGLTDWNDPEVVAAYRREGRAGGLPPNEWHQSCRHVERALSRMTPIQKSRLYWHAFWSPRLEEDDSGHSVLWN